MPHRGRLSFLKRHGGAAAAAVVMLACSGCATAPDTRCQASRPALSYHDTRPIRVKKTADAKIWDRQCTLVGVISSADAGW